MVSTFQHDIRNRSVLELTCPTNFERDLRLTLFTFLVRFPSLAHNDLTLWIWVNCRRVSRTKCESWPRIPIEAQPSLRQSSVCRRSLIASLRKELLPICRFVHSSLDTALSVIHAIVAGLSNRSHANSSAMDSPARARVELRQALVRRQVHHTAQFRLQESDQWRELRRLRLRAIHAVELPGAGSQSRWRI